MSPIGWRLVQRGPPERLSAKGSAKNLKAREMGSIKTQNTRVNKRNIWRSPNFSANFIQPHHILCKCLRLIVSSLLTTNFDDSALPLIIRSNGMYEIGYTQTLIFLGIELNALIFRFFEGSEMFQ